MIYIKKDITSIILDGNEYKVSKDKKYIEGIEKNYKIDEFRKEKGKKIPFVVISEDANKEGVVYGFSDEKNYEQWLKENKLDEGYERHKKILENAKRKMSPKKLEKIKEHQVNMVNMATEKFNKFLKKNNLKSDELEKINKLLIEDYNPYYREYSQNHAFLYDSTWWQGVGWVFPGDWNLGIWYPDLSWFGCNDRASSISTWFSSHVTLFDGIKWTGTRVDIKIAVADLDTIWGNWLGNRVSSIQVY
ncbi:MAG: hypothetical protein ACFFD2_23885 [Promethearchaeota archaeon]